VQAMVLSVAYGFQELGVANVSVSNEISLVDQLEDWRHFAKDLQKAFRSEDWERPIRGFTPYEGQIVRLLAKHPYLKHEQISQAIRECPLDEGPTPGSVKTMISRIRVKLKDGGLAVQILCSWSGWYATDRAALSAFIRRNQLHARQGRRVAVHQAA